MNRSVKEARSRFGGYLRRLRESVNITRENLMEKSRIERSLIRNLERGTALYTMPLVTQFIEALGIKFSTVLDQVTAYFDSIFTPATQRRSGPRLRSALA
jgi:transcriptional regulator with XRE-family HTH domain